MWLVSDIIRSISLVKKTLTIQIHLQTSVELARKGKDRRNFDELCCLTFRNKSVFDPNCYCAFLV